MGALSTIPLWLMLFSERRGEPGMPAETRRDVEDGRRGEPAIITAS